MSKYIERSVYLYDEHDYPVFKIDIEDPGDYRETSFNARVYSIGSWEADDSKKPIDEDTELYLSCYIKWDSCSHFWFGEKDADGNHDSYEHICGASYFKQHVDLMNYLYNLAFREMGREPYDKQDVWELDLKILKEHS